MADRRPHKEPHHQSGQGLAVGTNEPFNGTFRDECLFARYTTTHERVAYFEVFVAAAGFGPLPRICTIFDNAENQ